MTITAQLADGRTLEFPDGTAADVIQATVKRLIKPALPTPAFEREAAQIANADPLELIAGSAPGRFVQGMASPIVGAAQALTTNAEGRSPLDLGIEGLRTATERGRQAYGNEGFDWAGLAGNIASPVGLAAAKTLPAVSGVRRILQGGVIGAGYGATTPVVGENTWQQRGMNMGIGAGIGSAIPAAISLGSYPSQWIYYSIIEPWLDPLTVKGRTLIKSGGEKVQALIDALRNAREDITGITPTAGQAGSEVQAPAFAALAQASRERLPQVYNQRLDEQNAAQLAALHTIGQDKKAFQLAEQLRAENARANYGAVGRDLINPQSDAEIMANAIAQRERGSSGAVEDVRRLSGAAQTAENVAQSGRMRLDAGAPPALGLPRISGRYSYATELGDIAERKAREAAVTSLRQGTERRYLEDFTRMLDEAGELNTTPLRTFLSRPSVQDAIQVAMRGAKETGSYFPSAGEPFSVNNLQRIKAAISDVIADPKNPTGLQATERKEIGDTLGSFVSWLSNKSPGWKAARVQYAEDSLPLNQMQIGQYLENVAGRGWQPAAGGQSLNVKPYIEALRKSTDVGDTAMAQRAAELISKRVTGAPRYTELAGPEGPMNPKQMDIIEAVKNNMLRQQRLEGQAKTGISQLRELTPVPRGEDIQLWNRKMSVYHWIKRHAIGMANEQLADQLARDMLDPKVTADMMIRHLEREQRLGAYADQLRRAAIPAVGGAIQQGAQR